MISVVKAVLFGVVATAVFLIVGEGSRGMVSTTVHYLAADFDARAPGVIEHSAKVFVHARYSGHYQYRVRYSYEVAGKRYLSNRVNYSLPNKNPDAIVARYPVGAEVVVYYDSRRPQLSALEPSKLDRELWWFWAIMLAVLIGATAL